MSTKPDVAETVVVIEIVIHEDDESKPQPSPPPPPPSAARNATVEGVAMNALVMQCMLFVVFAVVAFWNIGGLLTKFPLTNTFARNVTVLCGFIELLAMLWGFIWAVATIDLPAPAPTSPRLWFHIYGVLVCLSIVGETYLRVSYLLFPCYHWLAMTENRCDYDDTQYSINLAFAGWNWFVVRTFVHRAVY